ncbi:MAG TPA: peptide-methionine (R)-S-oxide reductase MsrB [Candidatus Saccharimonadales bacterium]|nr:peptide-methionine (R)-S-oxide reductase MsrB [Candidatus Saccharimonadales bacterium]
MNLSEEEWKKKLSPEEYRVLRQKGTETPFTGKLLNEKRGGIFKCAACGAVLFKSDSKYDSTVPGLAGWPSFSEVAAAGAVELADDNSLGMHRIEAICKNCGSHLGHLFDDDSSPSGKHYCINSVCLDFNPEEPGNKV